MLARMGFLTEISGPPVTADLPARWVFDRLEEWAARFPNQLAFAVDRRDGVEEHRYADVLDHVNAIVMDFQHHGIQRGDKVGILMENIPQWVFVLLGAMRVGAVTVPLATTLPESTVHRFAEHAGCRILFADEPNLEKATAVARALGCEISCCTQSRNVKSTGSATTNKTGNFPVPSPQDTGLIIYTSG